MSVELATAYVSIVPSTQGIKGQLQNELGGPLEQQGKESGSKFGAAMSGAAGKALKLGGGAAVAGFGAALVGGFGRLRAIDDAQFKLQGLGHDADAVETIMGSALDSVKGTAFGLGDAATIAAGAVAAGVEPGDDLTRSLSLTGDAASIAGTSLGDMGAIFGKVGASNRMMTQEMNQLQDRGLPILQWLQEEYGVTADKAREMVSNGEVDFATFQKIIEDNIGGAALTAGESFRGSLANVGAAVGRFGAALLGPGFANAPALFGRITDVVDGLTNRVGPLIESITSTLGPAFAAVGDFVRPLLSSLGGGAGMAGILDTVGSAAGRLAEWLRGVLGAAVEWLKSVWEGLRPSIMSIGESFRGIWTTIQPVVQWIGERLPGAFQTLWSIAQPILGFLVGVIGDTLRMAIEGVVGVFNGAVQAIEGILNVFAGLFTGDWSRMWEGVKQIATGIFDLIVGAVKTFLAVTVFRVVGTAFRAITALFRNSWTGIRSIFTNAGQGIVSTVRGFVDTVRLRIMFLMDAIRIAIRGGWTAIQALFRNALTGIRSNVTNGVTNVVSTFRALPGRIVSAVGDLGRLLLNVGRDIVRGLIDGITGMAGAAGKAITGVVSGAVNAAKSRLGISSPSKVFLEMGHQIGEGLVGGLGDSERGARRAGSSLVGATVPAQPVLAAASAGSMAAMARQSAAALSAVSGAGSRHVILQVGERQFDAYLHDSTRRNAARRAVRTAT